MYRESDRSCRHGCLGAQKLGTARQCLHQVTSFCLQSAAGLVNCFDNEKGDRDTENVLNSMPPYLLPYLLAPSHASIYSPTCTSLRVNQPFTTYVPNICMLSTHLPTCVPTPHAFRKKDLSRYILPNVYTKLPKSLFTLSVPLHDLHN